MEKRRNLVKPLWGYRAFSAGHEPHVTWGVVAEFLGCERMTLRKWCSWRVVKATQACRFRGFTTWGFSYTELLAVHAAWQLRCSTGLPMCYSRPIGDVLDPIPSHTARKLRGWQVRICGSDPTKPPPILVTACLEPAGAGHPDLPSGPLEIRVDLTPSILEIERAFAGSRLLASRPGPHARPPRPRVVTSRLFTKKPTYVPFPLEDADWQP